MAGVSNDQFYSRLPVNEIPITELLTEEHLFFKVPENWAVIITDVKNSTIAVRNGLHETINLVATGSIVAVLNISFRMEMTVPFFFGGDGATFIVPPSILPNALQALLLHRRNTMESYDLDLRVGTVPVSEIYRNGHRLNISKLRTSSLFAIPVVLGNGLAYAEKIIKGEDYDAGLKLVEEELDLSGMQCRWDKIKPPENDYEVVSLLVMAREGANQANSFKQVFERMDEIYGVQQRRTPITISKLKLKTTFARIGLEMRTKFGGFNPFYLLRTWITIILGVLYFRTPKGKHYLSNLVELSDTLVIDGRINTVISGTAAQRDQLISTLNELESKGEITYGLFVSKESVMSCYVRNLNDKHIHFVDGSDGGYTKAAGVVKQKILQYQTTQLN